MKRFWRAAQVLVLGFIGSAFAVPFQNGSFEIGTLTADPCNVALNPGSTAITGWTVVSGNIEYLTPTCWQPSHGSRSLDLVGNGSIGGIQQTFDTIPGQTYEVIFDLAGNPSAAFPPGIKNLTVTVDGTPHNFTFDTYNSTVTTMGWTPHSFQFVAGGTGSTTISFVSNMAPSTFAGSALDNVRVLAIPAGAWTGSGGSVFSGSAAGAPPMICSGAGSNWNFGGSVFSYPTMLTGFGVQGPVIASYAFPPSGAVPALGACGSWTVAKTATVAGNVTVNWQYRGDHSSSARTADLRAFVSTPPSLFQFDNIVVAPPAVFSPFPGGGAASFNFSGQYTFTNVQVGSTYGFTMTGSNFDFHEFLNGTLVLTGTQVPTPGLLSSANPAPAGSPVTFTFTVNGGASAPTGTVVFNDNATPIAGCEAVPLVPTTATSSTAACTTSALSVGGHGINVSYSGDMTYQPSGGMLAQNISAAVATAPTLVRAFAVTPTQAYLVGRADSVLSGSVTFNASTASTCNAGALVGGSSAGTFVAATDAQGYFATTVPVTIGDFVAVQLTAPSASAPSACIVSSADNDFWPKALNMSLAPGVSEYIDALGKARWYKFSITPGQKVQVTLSGLPADYDIVVFKDIYQAFIKQLLPTSTTDLNKLNSEFAPSTFSPSTFSPSTFSPSTFSPDAYAPSTFSPSTFSPSTFSPSTFSPSTFSPSTFSPSTFSPSTFSPSTFSPSTFSPSTFSPSTFSPSLLLNLTSTQVEQAFSSAQTRSIIGVSATPGTGNELVLVNTWNDTGEYYVRVAGRSGAFSTIGKFTLNVAKSATSCTGVTPLSPFVRPAGPAGVTTVILTDSSKVALGTLVPNVTLLSKLQAFANRTEINGAIVDLNSDARVTALKAQAAANTACPYAMNLVAEEVKTIVDAYRANNPGLRYVVIIGNDSAVPFFRYPDETLIGQESNYDPPVLSTSVSGASLAQDFVLSQDAYGASTRITMRSIEFPIPGLAVGRLIETPDEIAGLLDAYTAIGGVVNPTSSLVTGYDFLADAANSIKTELQNGIVTPPQTLIAANGVAPQDPTAWNATQLGGALFGSRHDVVFLAGHFSANSALAADFTTSLLTSDLIGSTTDFTNSIVFSAGCHAGYNIVDTDAIEGLTVKLDWAQAFAQKKATLIAGTGYQYGDTDFIEYSEKLYVNFARQLRAGATGTSITVGEALNRAKLDYLAVTPDVRGIHQKAVLEATVFGLPMLSVNMPGLRAGTPVGTGVITPALVPSVPLGQPGYAGFTLGLNTASLSLTPAPTPASICMKNAPFDAPNPPTAPVPPSCSVPSGYGSYTAVQWLNGTDGVVSNPAEPVLPLHVANVTPTTNVALRGVGFLGGSYTDTTLIPLTGAPTTEIRGVHTSFSSPVLFPMRLLTPNYFGALGSTLGTRLLVTPVQHRADDLTLGTSVRRQFSNLNLRLYYSANTTAAALSAAPTIVNVTATPSVGAMTFAAQVVGDPAAAIHDVWVTYTAAGGPSGAWVSVPLTQCRSPAPPVCGTTTDTQQWMGELAAPPSSGKYIVQAVNGVGLVSLDDNLGAYYAFSTSAPPPAAGTTLALVSPPTSITYGDTPSVTAMLASGPTAISGAPLTFSVGGTAATTTTGAGGLGSANLAKVAPGAYTITVNYAGTASYLPSTASSPITVNPAPSAFLDDSSTVAPAAFLLALVGGVPQLQKPLIQELITFAVSQNGNLLKTFLVWTDLSGRAALPPTGLPLGTYSVTATFAGSELYLGSTLPLGNLQVTAPCPLGERTKVRWHYSANGSPGDWSSDAQISCANGFVAFPTQTTEGILTLAPTTTVKWGFALQLPGNKTHFNASVANGKAVFPVTCVSGATPSASSFTLNLPVQTVLLDNKNWNPTSARADPLGFQASGTVPDLCGGGPVRVHGGTFSASITLN